MTPDEWADLMEEPPGGENHGRSRIPGGVRHLDNVMASVLQADLHIIEDPRYESGRRSVKPPETIRHGTYSAYTHDRCRCDLCRSAKNEYQRRYRK